MRQSRCRTRNVFVQLGHLSMRHCSVVANCERLLTTAVCADENLVLQIKSAVRGLDQLEPELATALVAIRRWRRFGDGAHRISFRPTCFGAREWPRNNSGAKNWFQTSGSRHCV